MLLLIVADRLMTPHGSRCLAMNVGTSVLEVTTCVVSKSCVSRQHVIRVLHKRQS